jgi:hypothetical protein
MSSGEPKPGVNSAESKSRGYQPLGMMNRRVSITVTSSMTRRRQRRQVSDEWARTAKTDREREIFLQMARTWIEAAQRLEPRANGHQVQITDDQWQMASGNFRGGTLPVGRRRARLIERQPAVRLSGVS